MKSARLFVAAALTLASTSLPSYAYNHNVRDHFYHAPLEVQIIDAAPRIDDRRTQEVPSTTYVIEAPQKKAPASPVVSLAPSGAGSNIPNINSIGSNLAPASFQSNIKPGRGGMLNSLPNGTVMGHMGVQAQLKNANSGKPSNVVKSPDMVRQVASVPAQPAVYSYAPTAVSSGTSSMQVATKVQAQLASPPRGSLLH